MGAKGERSAVLRVCKCPKPSYKMVEVEFLRNRFDLNAIENISGTHGIKIHCFKCGLFVMWTNREGARRLLGV